MLSVTKYKSDYVEGCEARIEAQLQAYRALLKAASPGKSLEAARVSFEPLFFSNLVLALESSFVHRGRALEGKDGNALNEVRMIAHSLLTNNGVLAGDKTIKWTPEKTVLKLPIGAPICLSEADFVRLFKAYFGAIKTRFA